MPQGKPSESPELFLTTRWSLVLPAAVGNAAAMAGLCQAYWKPVYGLFRWWGHTPAESEDLTQEFFHRLLQKEWLAPLKEEGGKFRAFLFTLLKRFRADEYARQTAIKRGGQVHTISMDAPTGERSVKKLESGLCSPDLAFDRLWAMELLDRAMLRLESEILSSPKARLWPRMKPLLAAEAEQGECQAIARDVGLTSNNISVTLLRWRKRIRELVMEEIHSTVSDDQLADEEFSNLLDSLRPH
jgi:DNA-directed RNA polymerase specialized sigma24 family protein